MGGGLARRGAELVLGCRSTERGEVARKGDHREHRGDAVTAVEVDLSSPASVRALTAAFRESVPEAGGAGQQRGRLPPRA
jgi:NAD(P)-dependent dehydrogenase (short-subunit alcohol dehydrogenase family)